jgi:hypothetical protein
MSSALRAMVQFNKRATETTFKRACCASQVNFRELALGSSFMGTVPDVTTRRRL